MVRRVVGNDVVVVDGNVVLAFVVVVGVVIPAVVALVVVGVVVGVVAAVVEVVFVVGVVVLGAVIRAENYFKCIFRLLKS